MAPLQEEDDEDNPLLLAAYDLLFCSSVSAAGGPSALPSSLLSFIIEEKRQQMYGKEGGSCRKPQADTKTEQATRARQDKTCNSSEPPHQTNADANHSEMFGDSGAALSLPLSRFPSLFA